MKKILCSWIFFLMTVVYPAAAENLYERYKDYPEIRIYLRYVTNETGDRDVSADLFEEAFRDVLKARAEIKFTCVDSEDNADVIINADIKKYAYKQKTRPTIFGAAALYADMSRPKSSGKLKVDYEVLDARTGKEMLFFNNFTTETRMPRENMRHTMGFINAATRNIERFIYRAFYKPKK